MSQQADDTGTAHVFGLGHGPRGVHEHLSFEGFGTRADEALQAVDHLALLYEDRTEQLATAVPFISNGLDQHERCLYITDEHGKAEIETAMRAHGISVDDAYEAGALAVLTQRDTYCRDGTFDPDAMLAYLSDIVDEAIEAFDGLRITGEMSWILDEGVDFADVMVYEQRLNEFFPSVKAIGLCQYDCNRFSPDMIRDVIRTHPYLIHDGVVMHNAYFVRPESVDGEIPPAEDVERMLGTLHDRTTATTSLASRQATLARLIDIITDGDRTFEDQLQALFELGVDRFDLDFGGLARVDRDADWFEVEYGSGEHPYVTAGDERPLSETYCTVVANRTDVVSISAPETTGFAHLSAYREFGIQSYLGTFLPVAGDADRTFFFVGLDPRERAFSADDRTFLRLMGQWVSDEIARMQRVSTQRKLYDIAAAPHRSFDEKLQSVFELGCDRFGLRIGGLARVDAEADRITTEAISRSPGNFAPGVTQLLSESFSRAFWEDPDRTTMAITDPETDGFADTRTYSVHEFTAYLGTRIAVEENLDRVLFFTDDTPRSTAFSAAERRFIELMGQWIQYEFERQHHTDLLAAFESAFPDLGFLIDAEGRYLDWVSHPATTDLLVTDPETLIGQTMHEVLPTHLAETLVTRIRDAIDSGERQTIEYELAVSAGKRWFESRIVPLTSAGYTRDVVVFVARDITDRKQRELDQQQYHALTQAASDVIVTLDTAGTIHSVNPAITDVFGYHMDELVGESITTLMPDKLADQHRASFSRYLRTGESTFPWDDVEVRGKHADGFSFPVSVSFGETEYDGDRFFTGIIRDISERKSHVRALRETNRRLDLALDGTGSSVWEWNTERDEVTWTAGLEQLLGLILGTFSGGFETVLTYVHPDDKAAMQAAVATAVERDEPYQHELRLQHVDGHYLWIEARGQCVSVAGERCLIGLATDISDRKGHEQELAHEKRRFETIFEQSNDAIFVIDPATGRYTDANSRALALLGYPREELLSTIGIADVHPDHHESVQHFLRTVQADGSGWTDEFTCLTADGDTRDIELSAAVLDLPGTTADAVICTIRDITIRKRRQQAIERQRRELAQLERLNTLVREILQTVSQPDTRGEIEAAVCHRLTESSRYRAAWVGTCRADELGGRMVSPRTSAGIDEKQLDRLHSDGCAPAVTAVQNEAVQIVTGDTPPLNADRGGATLAAVPLTTEETTYGVLVVYAVPGHDLTDAESSVLGDLGKLLALSIQRVQSQQSLMADTAVELTVRFPHDPSHLAVVSDMLECELALDQFVPLGDDHGCYYLTVTGSGVDDVDALLGRLPDVRSVTRLQDPADERPARIELVHGSGTRWPLHVFLDHGGVVRSTRSVDGETTVTVQFARDVDVRTVMHAVQVVEPTAELVSKRFVDHVERTQSPGSLASTGALTEKQRAALRIAHERGYYEWPRSSTAEDLADIMSISSATLHYRLRKAHDAVIGSALEGK